MVRRDGVDHFSCGQVKGPNLVALRLPRLADNSIHQDVLPSFVLPCIVQSAYNSDETASRSSKGLANTATPALFTSSSFASAVVLFPKTIVPACPFFFPGGAFSPSIRAKAILLIFS